MRIQQNATDSISRIKKDEGPQNHLFGLLEEISRKLDILIEQGESRG